MAIRITCPACKTPNTVGDDKRGRKVRCQECATPIPVPEADSATKKRAADEAIQKDKGRAAAKSRPDADDDEGRRPKPKKAGKAASKGFPMVLVIGGVVAALLLCVVGGVGIAVVGGGMTLFRTAKAAAADEPRPGPQAQVNHDDDVNGQKPPPPPPDPNKKDPVDNNPNKKGPLPVVDPDAGKALPAQIAPEHIAKVKQATVYLRVTMPSGAVAEGSGFFTMERGIIVTNAHVLGMLGAASKPPKQVDVVQDSGLPTEVKMIGDVLGVDRASDLAVVRVPDNGRLPAPLSLASEMPTELQKVYIFGFPFGEKLGKNITINEQAINSLRPDATGALEQLQINGGMNPGNSGGPVVNTRGNLVGVSVSIISGAQISFAVPAEKVRRIMEGRVADHIYGEAFLQQGQPRMPLKLKCLDPLNKIRDLRVEVWTAPAGAIRPAADQKPQPLPGDGPRVQHVAKYANGMGTVEVPLPALPGGHVYWVQPVLNGMRWGRAQPTATDFAVLERKPANLVVDLARHKERTGRVDSRFTIIESFGKRESKVVEHTTVELLEVVQDPVLRDGKKIANIRTAVGAVNVRVTVNNKPVKFDRDEMDALAISRGMAPTFVIDDTNATAGYLKVSMSPNHPKIFLKSLVETFNGMINNPFEATQFKMPNRLVQPQETFASQSTMMMRIGSNAATPKGKGPPPPATIYDLKLNCTLEGVRVRNGREEAVISVVGTMESRKKVQSLGDITGKIGFDIAGGFVSSGQLKIFAEYEENIPGLGTLRESITQDITLDRIAGNPKNLALSGGGKDPGPNPGQGAKGKLVLNQNLFLNQTDPIDPAAKGIQARMKAIPVQLQANVNYVISMNSTAFDTYLRLIDATGRQLAEDDDSGGNLNARIIFRPTQAGLYRIVATSFRANSFGPFQLIVQELDAPKGGLDPPKVGGDLPMPPNPGRAAFVKPAKSDIPTNYLKVVSTPGDYIGQGKTYDYSGDQLVAKRTMRGVNINVDGWILDIGAPVGQFLQVGEYQDAKRFPFSKESPGLTFHGKGRGANRIAGEFVVWELEVNGDQIVRLAIDFVQRCEEKQPPLQGKLRINSTLQM